MSRFDAIRKTLRSHRLALLGALLVGVLYVAPHVLFIASLGDEYQGIPMLQTPNEDYYLTRIREVVDGHYGAGSFMFFEYKDAPSLTPPTIEFLYALPTLLLGIPYVLTAIASRFFLPALLFLLVYFLMLRLATPDPSEKERGIYALVPRIGAIAGALFVTLGVDIINYRGILSFLHSTDALAGSFLIWSRLVHPIGGALFLFSFLLCLSALASHTRYRKGVMFAGALLLALMFSSYFFSWGVALSILAALALLSLFKKAYALVKELLLVLLGALLLSAPYWWNAFRASQSVWYEESVFRSGLFYTHYPLMNKFILAILLVYAALVWLAPAVSSRSFPRRRESGLGHALDGTDLGFRGGSDTEEEEAQKNSERRNRFLLAVLLGSLWVYVEQTVTGITIWPYHFAQYTIPLGIVAFLVVCYNFVWTSPVLRGRLRLCCISAWWAGVTLIVISSLLYGLGVQTIVYRDSFERYADIQSYAPLVRLLNEEEECVVFTNKTSEGRNWNYFLTAFTPCDVYAESGPSLLMPYERIYHGYLATLRLRGVPGGEIERYMEANPAEMREYLFGNWQGLYGVRDFPDVTDPALEERRTAFPEAYRAFLKKDFKEELARYRLDYILSLGPLDPTVLRELSGVTLIQTAKDMYLYRFDSPNL